MLSRYDGKKIRLTTTDGVAHFEGAAWAWRGNLVTPSATHLGEPPWCAGHCVEGGVQ